MTPTDASLDDLRREIDEIDRELHALLIRRGGLAHRIAAVKGPDGPFWRPAREALVIRRLIERHHGDFPPATVYRVWRQIMTATVALEGRISVAAYVPADARHLWDITRDHFGAIPVTQRRTVGAVIQEAADSPTVIGMLPAPREDDGDPWWRLLVAKHAHGPRIVARLPFLDGGPQPGAVLIARAPVEASGDDRSYLVVETLTEMSRARLLQRLAAAGFETGLVATCQESGRNIERLNLVDVAGFVIEADPRLGDVRAAEPEAFGRILPLGAYAAPLPATTSSQE